MDLHPVFTHFPISLLILVFVAELLLSFKGAGEETHRFISFILWFSVVTTIAAFFTGYNASENANKTFMVPDAAIATHYAFGRLLVFSAPITAVLQLASRKAINAKKIFRTIYLLSLLTSAVLAVMSGFYGGELVFKHGAGVTGQQ